MGSSLVRALCAQPQFLRMYLMHGASRVFFWWLPNFILHQMHRNGLGRLWKIQGMKKPKAAMAWSDFQSSLQGEFVGGLVVQFLFHRFLTAHSVGRTIGASVGSIVGGLVGGGSGVAVVASLRSAVATYIAGQVGSTVGSLAGAKVGAAIGNFPQMLTDTPASTSEPLSPDKASDEVEQGWAGLRFGGPLPSLMTHVWQVFVGYAGYDMMFYWTHRLMHHPRLYKHCHKQHHEYHTPIGLAATHQHIIEGIIQLFNWYVPIACAGWLNKKHGGLHVSTLFCYNSFRWIETVDAHCGYEFPFSPFHIAPMCLGARGHDYHHREFHGAYGAMIFWDRLCGTDAGFLKEIAEEGILMAGERRPLC